MLRSDLVSTLSPLSLSVLFSAISLSFSLLPSPPSSLTPPVSREGEWIFSSDSGLKGLAEQSCYHRLVVVTMHLGHQYGDLHQVKHEVTGSALAMLQSGVPSNIKVRRNHVCWFFFYRGAALRTVDDIFDWNCKLAAEKSCSRKDKSFVLLKP